MTLLRFLGLEENTAGRDKEPASLVELVAQLEELPEAEARFTAAFAYLLARVADADLQTDDVEREAIAARLERLAGLESTQAGLLADAAVRMADAHSATDNHLVARAFRDMSDPIERVRLLRCLYSVAAADELISTREDNEIFEIASEIGVSAGEVVAMRSEFKEHLGSLKPLSRER